MRGFITGVGPKRAQMESISISATFVDTESGTKITKSTRVDESPLTKERLQEIQEALCEEAEREFYFGSRNA